MIRTNKEALPRPAKLTDMNLVAIQRDNGEQYVFIYDSEPESVKSLRQTLGKFAANPELSLTWGDAGWLLRRAGEIESAA